MAASSSSTWNLGHLAAVAGVVTEVANTVVLTFVATEVLVQKRSLRQIAVHIVVLIVLNVLLSPVLYRWLAVVKAGALSEAAAVGEAALSLQNRTASAAQAASRKLAQPAVAATLRVLCVLTGFLVLMYMDVCRMRSTRYTMAAYAKDLRCAFWLVLPVFPFLVAGFSCVFLVIVSFLTKCGLPDHTGEEIIFYGQFYAPLSAVYWIVKKDWVEAERHTTPLPTSFGKEK
mmetsp:Transcript_7973/g.17751  ORF Transcript_7973/g.17751 Transcript_7973/m.17751 type:complete len:230 (-) Transcript_7973:159-848(-)